MNNVYITSIMQCPLASHCTCITGGAVLVVIVNFDITSLYAVLILYGHRYYLMLCPFNA